MKGLPMNHFSELKQNLQNSRASRILVSLVSRYLNQGVGIKAAALAYHLIFSVFPLLILVGNILGLMDFNIDSLGQSLQGILPANVISLLGGYLEYIHQTSSRTILTFSIVFSIYFPYRAVRDLMEDVRDSFGLHPRQSFFKDLFWQLLCTLLIPVTFFLTFLLVVAGQNVISFLVSLLPAGTIRLSSLMLTTWQYLRFLLAAMLLSFSLGILYRSSLNWKLRWKDVLPGITFAVLFWLLASSVFSFYVENFASYSVIYGTLGGFMVMLLWLYLTGVIFIMGSELNAAMLEGSARKTASLQGLRKKSMHPAPDEAPEAERKEAHQNER